MKIRLTQGWPAKILSIIFYVPKSRESEQYQSKHVCLIILAAEMLRWKAKIKKSIKSSHADVSSKWQHRKTRQKFWYKKDTSVLKMKQKREKNHIIWTLLLILGKILIVFAPRIIGICLFLKFLFISTRLFDEIIKGNNLKMRNQRKFDSAVVSLK